MSFRLLLRTNVTWIIWKNIGILFHGTMVNSVEELVILNLNTLLVIGLNKKASSVIQVNCYPLVDGAAKGLASLAASSSIFRDIGIRLES